MDVERDEVERRRGPPRVRRCHEVGVGYAPEFSGLSRGHRRRTVRAGCATAGCRRRPSRARSSPVRGLIDSLLGETMVMRVEIACTAASTALLTES